MKRILLALAIISSAIASWSNAGWVDKQGNAIPDSEHMKSVGDLVAQLVVTDNEAEVLKNWGTPSESVYFPTTDKIERDKFLSIFVVFGGCGTDQQGNCDLRMKITIFQPNGSVYSELSEMEVWSRKPVPPNRSLGLSVGYIRVRIEPNEPLGAYSVQTQISDRVSGKGMLLASGFEVIEAQ